MMIVQEPVQAAVWHCLNNYDYSDAVFLAERLHAEAKSEATAHLLATSYYRTKQPDRVYHLLRGSQASGRCRLLFALAAFELEKYAEAEGALIDTDQNQKLQEVDFGDQAAFAHLLLGKIRARTERPTTAAMAWHRALKLNPFLFSAFELLCDIGEQPDPDRYFTTENIDNNVSHCHGRSLMMDVDSVQVSAPSPLCPATPDGFFTPPAQLFITSNTSAKSTIGATPDCNTVSVSTPLLSGFKPLAPSTTKNFRHRLNFNSQESPSFGMFFSIDSVTPSSPATAVSASPAAAPKRVRTSQFTKPVLGQTLNVPKSSAIAVVQDQQPSDLNLRRSSRLFSSNSVKENDDGSKCGGGGQECFVAPKTPASATSRRKKTTRSVVEINNAKNHLESTPPTISPPPSSPQLGRPTFLYPVQKDSATGAMALLRLLGHAHLAHAQYDCVTAAAHLSDLSPCQRDTAWAQARLGLTYFERHDYESSARHFDRAHKLDPHHLEHMDVYSTALWHLQREVALSALAQDLLSVTGQGKTNPVAWCAAGNCFSLHKEHDAAIKCFERAVQVGMGGQFWYAYTLLGHEYVATEELDRATSCFLNATRINPRHYNAWFGLGTIYAKQERYITALYHYQRALTINPRSSVILCHVGIVQHALNQTDKALTTLDRAIAAHPDSALCRFHRASLYFARGRHSDALLELDDLKRTVPKESSVHYLIGKVHKKLGNTDLALQHFSWATDLDPKGASGGGGGSGAGAGGHVKEVFDPAIAASITEEVEEEEDDSGANHQQQQQESLNFEALPDDSEDSVFE